MLQIYCYEKCSTCKKALRWLDAKNVEYKLFDIKEQHPDAEALRGLWEKSGLPLKRFFNTSGMLYREKKLSERLPAMSDEEKLELLATDGMLVKRPLVIGDDFVLTGFNESEWERHIL